jgi:hypothetical protein
MWYNNSTKEGERSPQAVKKISKSFEKPIDKSLKV